MIIQGQRIGIRHGESVHLTLNDTAAVALTKATAALQHEASADLRRKSPISREQDGVDETDRKSSDQRSKKTRAQQHADKAQQDAQPQPQPQQRDFGHGKSLLDINV